MLPLCLSKTELWAWGGSKSLAGESTASHTSGVREELGAGLSSLPGKMNSNWALSKHPLGAGNLEGGQEPRAQIEDRALSCEEVQWGALGTRSYLTSSLVIWKEQ